MTSSYPTGDEVIRFEPALRAAAEVVGRYREPLGDRVIVVRDLFGRIRLALDVPRDQVPAGLVENLHRVLGAYSPGQDGLLLLRSEMFDPAAVFESPDLTPLTPGIGTLLLDRAVTGQDWGRRPFPRAAGAPPRATLFGVKGGVGRSTALIVWAHALARQGRKVLAVDLDLESPALSATLLPRPAQTDFGVVDWLVEDAVGQADETLLQGMVADSPLSGDRGGRVRVVGAGAGPDPAYLTKLSRAYLEVARPEGRDAFADRVRRMLEALEAQEAPDVVLIDSRAGIHDIAAVAVTRLAAEAFLFAVEGPHTWYAYRLLMEHWRRHPALASFRDRLKMVCAMLPETGATETLTTFVDSSYTLFAETLYEEAGAAVPDTAVFNFDRGDEEAPHYPLRIAWSRRFQEFDPLGRTPAVLEWPEVMAAYGDFLRRATLVVTGNALEEES